MGEKKMLYSFREKNQVTNLREHTFIGWKPQVILSTTIISQQTHLKHLTKYYIFLSSLKPKKVLQKKEEEESNQSESLIIQIHPQKYQSADSQYG
jgi:hypothetical protein